MKRWVRVLLAVVIGVPVLAYGAGVLIPRDHVASLSIDLAAPPDRVWPLISDFGNTAKWRSDITAVRLQPQPDGRVRFLEASSQGEIPFEVVSQEAPHRPVVRVVDDDQPFGGTWTWDLQPSGTGTRLTITEAGFVKSPIFRTMGLIFFSPTQTIDAYLRALAKALGETAVPH
jgi:uncharacterized protein YndB with AHSA1/START domain